MSHRHRPGKPSEQSTAKIRIKAQDACPVCARPSEFCFCGKTTTVDNRLSVVILEHPQEKFKLLNSSVLASEILINCTVKSGLSWRNLQAATGSNLNPSEWAILYLKGTTSDNAITLRNRNKQIVKDYSGIKGIIALNGTWQQAKTLWWRNPWFLKLNTIELNPDHISMRNQVRKEGLSTIEAIGFALSILESNSSILENIASQYLNFIIEPSKQYKPSQE